MDALDLTKSPPRSPRALLAGLDLLMAARTVDKLRATLPGGNIGSYQITGFSSRLLDALGIAEGPLREVIAKADSDDEIARWIAEHSDPQNYAKINASLEQLTIAERVDDPEFRRRYPIVTTLDRNTPRLDMLIADDRASFP